MQADGSDAAASSNRHKFARAIDAIRDETRKARSKTLDTFADVVQAVAAYDKDGHIKLQFDADDEQYDIDAMKQETDARQHFADKLLHPSGSERIVHDVPAMNVCIMIVGTRGDVQPFIGIAKRLQQDGHRVRLATHAVYRDFVMEHGVEFYPLGGDPKELAAYMVKTGGHLIPLKLETIQKDIPRNMQMIEEILHTTWPAVSAADPDGGGSPGVAGKPFQAHAIISNPVTYGHIHVAERLGVPLHIMFPQPWVPTVAFPHPLSNLPYTNKASKKNYLSYKLVDLLMWQGTESMVNEFRTEVLGLRKIRKGDGGRDMLLDLAIPHAFMWSSALVPKPADWGHIYDVIGTVTLKEAGSKYTPTPELEAFLGSDGGPIFVGFGSMVIDDPKKTSMMIIEAAKLAGARVLIQSSWSDMAAGLDVPDNIFFLGNCPHDWLMPRVSAVVHHGGAGTTAAGLMAGKPTFIVPFFGDQPFWGRAVVTAGVGVEPCPISELSVEKLHTAFKGLQSPELRANALKLRDVMLAEDGVGAAVDAFYRNLPLKSMRCDLGCSRIAIKWSQKDRLKLCEQCVFVISSRPENSTDDIVEYDPVDYTARGPDSALEGVASGAGAFIHELGSGVKDIFIKPTQGYRDEGAKGAVIGLMKGIGGIFIRPVQGAALFADHIATGHYNENRASDERKKGTVLLENKKLLNALGYKTMPDTHTAAMDPHEQLEMDRRAGETQSIAIHLSPDERVAMEAKFNDIMRARSLESSDDDFVVVRGGGAKDSGAAPKAHLVVSSTELTAKGEVNIRFRNNSTAGQSLDGAELQWLVDAARVEQSAQNSLFSSVSSKRVPHMNICMMTTGSWDESVQQFVAIGLRLKADGHRVRIATNSGFRDRIIAAGLEFYPLGGRATTTGKFLQYLYELKKEEKKSKGLFGFARNIRTRSTFPEVEDLKELMFSLWPACVDVDPLAPGRAFRADAIVAHPFMFGQTAVAERLGVPLHCMSYNPLSRTQAFPHLMSASLTLSQPYRYAPTNLISYDVISNTMWSGMRELLDSFRSSLGLTGKSVGTNLLAEWRVPHSYLWDPELLPKPMDWGREIDVAGYVQLDEPSEADDHVVAISLRLDEFVAQHVSTPLVYFGFVRADWEPRHMKDLQQKIEAAARQTGVRVIFQTLEESDGAVPLYASDAVLEVSALLPPKDIFKHVRAVVHWGDLSITSSALAAGKPACVVARNVTQRLWGQALRNAGVGVEHLELEQLTVESLAHAFQTLLAPQLADTAARVAASVSSSAAVENAVRAFYANLPLAAMTCDLDPTRIARIYDPVHQLKLSYEAHVVVRQLAPGDGTSDIKYKPLKYSLHHPPRLSLRGIKDDVAVARGLVGGAGRSGSGGDNRDAPHLPVYTYDVLEDDRNSSSKSSKLSSKLAPVGKLRGKLNRYQSVAANVIETPAFWTSPDDEERETQKINVAYEKLLLARETPGHAH